MLCKFEVKNYKSFVDKTIFSMIAAPKQKDLEYSLQKEKIKNKIIKGLCSSVIYGPNASGKTNILGAMDVLRSIVIRGNVLNANDNSLNFAKSNLELIPNNRDKNNTPVEFAIEFIEQGHLFYYQLSIILGRFLETNYPRKITSEELSVDNELVFKRDNDKIYFGRTNSLLKNISLQTLTSLSENGLYPTELFLTNGFKLISSQYFVRTILDWFTNKLMIVYRADSIQLTKKIIHPQKDAIYIEETINNAAKIFGINSNALGYKTLEENPSETELCSIFNNKVAIPANLIESYGTIRFINLFPLIIQAIVTGSTLVIDEFDASIHPIALMNIVNVFHNNDINIHHSQLIFNTHNPIFLNANLLRRDEIKLVERDDMTHKSTLYSLADFGTSGLDSVRKTDDYMKKYFINQYGAIKDIDFSPIFENIINQEVLSSNEKKAN